MLEPVLKPPPTKTRKGRPASENMRGAQTVRICDSHWEDCNLLYLDLFVMNLGWVGVPANRWRWEYCRFTIPSLELLGTDIASRLLMISFSSLLLFLGFGNAVDTDTTAHKRFHRRNWIHLMIYASLFLIPTSPDRFPIIRQASAFGLPSGPPIHFSHISHLS